MRAAVGLRDAEGGQQLSDTRRQIEDPRHRSARSQRASLDRVAAREDETRSHLERLDARLDEAVVRAAELATRSGGSAELDDVAARVETVVDELESLRIAFDELATGR